MRKRKENNMVTREPEICRGGIDGRDPEAASYAIKENNDTFNYLFGTGAVINPLCGITKVPTVYDEIYNMQDFMREASEKIMNDPNVDKLQYIDQRRLNFFDIFGNRVRYLAMNIIGNVVTLLRLKDMYISYPNEFHQDMMNIIVPYFDGMIDNLEITKAENLTNLNVIAYFQNEVIPTMLSGIFNCVYRYAILETRISSRTSDVLDKNNYHIGSEYDDSRYNEVMNNINGIMESVREMLCFTYYQVRSELLMYYHNNTLLEHMPAAIQQQEELNRAIESIIPEEESHCDCKCKSIPTMEDVLNDESNPFSRLTITRF